MRRLQPTTASLKLAVPPTATTKTSPATPLHRFRPSDPAPKKMPVPSEPATMNKIKELPKSSNPFRALPNRPEPLLNPLKHPLQPVCRRQKPGPRSPLFPLDQRRPICQNLVTDKGEQKANMSTLAMPLKLAPPLLRDIAQGFRKHEERIKLSTGIPAMDQLTAGGIARGVLTEICGPVSSGRTSFLLALLSQATRQGECCAWIDTAGAFDPQSAVEAGADLDRVLWVNCDGNTEHALKAVDLLTQGGGFGLVVLDMADTPERDVRRISLASWFRLRHAAERTGAALVVAETTMHARSCSAMQIEMKRKQPVWVGKLLRGIRTHAESQKHHRVQAAEFTAVV